jgi:hypothetical protein
MTVGELTPYQLAVIFADNAEWVVLNRYSWARENRPEYFSDSDDGESFIDFGDYPVPDYILSMITFDGGAVERVREGN